MDKTAAQKLAASIKLAEINGVMGALLETDLVKIASEEDYAVIADAIAERLPEDWDLDTMLAAVDEVMAKYNEIMAAGAEGGMDVEASETGMPEAAEVGTEEKAPEPAPVKAEKATAENKAEAEIDDPAAKLASMGISEMDVYAMLGQLTMEKSAGEISDKQFRKEANRLTEFLSSMGGKIRSGAGSAYDAVKAAPGQAWDAAKAAPGNLYEGAKAYPGKVRDTWQHNSKLKNSLKGYQSELKDLPGGVTKARMEGLVGATADELSANRRELLKQLGIGAAAAGGVGAGGYGLAQLLRGSADDEDQAA